jgi:hypothetical protein
VTLFENTPVLVVSGKRMYCNPPPVSVMRTVTVNAPLFDPLLL